MEKTLATVFYLLFASNVFVFGQADGPATDEFAVDGGKLTITFLGHASLIINYRGLVIYVDPVAQYGPFDAFHKADLVLITHEHGDHWDPRAIADVRKEGTRVIADKNTAGRLPGSEALANGEKWSGFGISVEAVPAYNTTQGRERFHPKGRDNGYVLTLGKRRIYIAGDTEDIPEMAALKNIDIAFLPCNQPYTMTPAQLKKAAALIMPKILYPYHLGDTDTEAITALCKDLKGIDLRLKKMR